MKTVFKKAIVLSTIILSQTAIAKSVIFQDRISDSVHVKYTTDYGIRERHAVLGERGGYQLRCHPTGFLKKYWIPVLVIYSSMNINQTKNLDFSSERILGSKDQGSPEACAQMRTYFDLVSPANPLILKIYDDNSMSLEFEKQ